MIPVKILGVQMERMSGSPVVLLVEQGTGERVLPIFIGAPEARAIALALEGVEPPRPATHDLLASVLRELDSSLVRVDVTELRSGTFIAELEVATPDKDHRISCRPSDALALALRFDAPVYVDGAVLEEAGVEIQNAEDDAIDDDKIEEAVAEFQEFLQNMRPEDFGSGDEGDQGPEGGAGSS